MPKGLIEPLVGIAVACVLSALLYLLISNVRVEEQHAEQSTVTIQEHKTESGKLCAVATFNSSVSIACY